MTFDYTGTMTMKEAIFSSDLTDFILPLANGPSILQGFKDTQYINHLPETIPTGRLYFRQLVLEFLT